jgi:hypothetical protein
MAAKSHPFSVDEPAELNFGISSTLITLELPCARRRLATIGRELSLIRLPELWREMPFGVSGHIAGKLPVSLKPEVI